MPDVWPWLPVRLATLEEVVKAYTACVMRVAGDGFVTPGAILGDIEDLELWCLKRQQQMMAKAMIASATATSATSVMAVDAAVAAVPDDVSEDEGVPDDVAIDATLESASMPVEVDWTDFTAMAITVSGRSSAAIADTEAERAAAIAAEAEAKQLAVIAAAEQHFADMAANAQELIEADARMAAITQQIKSVEGIKTTTGATAVMGDAAFDAVMGDAALDAVMADAALDAVMGDAAAAFDFDDVSEEEDEEDEESASEFESESEQASSRSPSPSSRSPTAWKVPKTTASAAMKKKKMTTTTPARKKRVRRVYNWG